VQVEQLVYSFEEAHADRVGLLGGKGAGLAAMTARGLPVPPGFIITTEAARSYLASGELSEMLVAEIKRQVAGLEARTERRFGGDPPLLVSVRSGAPISMPGMMDTILDLGLNEDAAIGLVQSTGSVHFMADVYIRFHRMFADIVLGADSHVVGIEAAAVLTDQSLEGDARATFRRLRTVLTSAERDLVDAVVPDDPYDQLLQAVGAIFDSWNSRRAVTYRQVHGIPDTLGTAAVVQLMVFGNLGSPSGSGVVFSRNPVTGEPALYGEFLEGGQGEEVVGGTVTASPIAQLAERQPDLYSELCDHARRLEADIHDVVDIEFTIEQGRLYLLQVRPAKRTSEAALRITADFLRDGRFHVAEALARLTVADVRQVERARFDAVAVDQARASGALIAQGVGASPGQVSGIVVVDPDRAVEIGEQGTDVILVRPTTSPLDLHGMVAAVGVVTALGGATSHAAVVARALGKPCVVGCRDITVDVEGSRLQVNGSSLVEGAELSIDGASGEVFRGALPVGRGDSASADRSEVLSAARDAAPCRVYGVVTTVAQVHRVRRRGPAGVAIRIGQVLATTGRLEQLLELVRSEGDIESVDFSGFEQVIADELVPLLAAAGDTEVAIRAVDLMAEEAVEWLDPLRIIDTHPLAGFPLGLPELLRVQILGVATAAARSRYERMPQLVVRNICDPLEVIELRRIADETLARTGLGEVAVGAFVTSPRGADAMAQLAKVSDVLWLDARRLRAAAVGYHPSLFLTAAPLDEYVSRGMLSKDPRKDIDETYLQVLASAATTRVSHSHCRLGVRLHGPVTEEIIAAHYRAGLRMFAVDDDEVDPTELALAKAALADLTAMRARR
jgi:pyruvate,orthophosphate dikinase